MLKNPKKILQLSLIMCYFETEAPPQKSRPGVSRHWISLPVYLCPDSTDPHQDVIVAVEAAVSTEVEAETSDGAGMEDIDLRHKGDKTYTYRMSNMRTKLGIVFIWQSL